MAIYTLRECRSGYGRGDQLGWDGERIGFGKVVGLVRGREIEGFGGSELSVGSESASLSGGHSWVVHCEGRMGWLVCCLVDMGGLVGRGCVVGMGGLARVGVG